MKKRLVLLVLCVALLAALLLGTPGAADNKLNFIAINDTLPPELINTAVSYGGQTYVPAWLFTSYSLGISYVYFASVTTAYLYSGDQQLFFELASGKTYDGDDFAYSTPAIFQGGTVYLPLSFVCNFFGTFSYSNIGENEYGRVLRITNGSQILSDQEFLRAAGNAMKTYYQSYSRPGVTPSTVPSPKPPAPTASPHQNVHVRLALLGLPDARLLEMLQRTGTAACFFLTGAEAAANPDLVRRLACSGYELGIRCPSGSQEEYDEAKGLLMEIARVCSILVELPAEAPDLPGTVRLQADGTLPAEGDPIKTAYRITAQLENLRGDMTLALACGEANTNALALILYYLSGSGFTVTALRVTD